MESAVRDDWEGPRDSRRGPSCRVEPCCRLEARR